MRRESPPSRARSVLLAGYGATLALVVAHPVGPRLFWTVIMPLVPAGIVLAGFHAWRRACPIAAVGALGARLHRGRRRVPARWRRLGLRASFAVLLTCLALRLVGTNGDPLALGVFLGGLGLAAFALNLLFGGRSFCHHACPVGVVERIYTDAAPAVARPERAASGCAPCTGCAKGCADLDRERAYERGLAGADRRLVFYAFPGLVFAFYAYYALRAGTWEAYFDGRWTEAPMSAELLLGPGFAFAPSVPALVAAPLTLLAGSALSALLFHGLERALARAVPDARRRRHRVLALASFAAFNTFYFFAGAPTLRLLPGASRVVAFAIPVIATVVLAYLSELLSESVERAA